MADLLKSLRQTLTYTPPELKFGVRGDGKCEECSTVTVWTRLIGMSSQESWRFSVESDTPLEKVQALLQSAVGHSIDQHCFVDERGYRFSTSDLSKPVAFFSNGCKLHVDLTYDVAHKFLKSKIQSVV